VARTFCFRENRIHIVFFWMCLLGVLNILAGAGLGWGSQCLSKKESSVAFQKVCSMQDTVQCCAPSWVYPWKTEWPLLNIIESRCINFWCFLLLRVTYYVCLSSAQSIQVYHGHQKSEFQSYWLTFHGWIFEAVSGVTTKGFSSLVKTVLTTVAQDSYF